MTKLVNRAKMTTATTGTGTITLGSAVDGFQTFADAGVANTNVVRYVIEDGSNWEIGLGTYSSTGPTLTRGSIESNNADAAINLSGNAVVFLTAAAADLQELVDFADNFVLPTADGTNGQVLTTNGSGTLSFTSPGASLTGQTDSASPFETSFGFGAGAVNTGVNNTFIGYEAGNDNTTATDNTALGFRALDVNTTGSRNTALGSNALGNFTTGASNIGVGPDALLGSGVSGGTGNSNIGIGSLTGSVLTTGSSNVLIGNESGASLTTGSNNVAIGVGALDRATTGGRNVAIGQDAMGLGIATAATGDNVAIGYQAGYDLTSGTDNVIIGDSAGANLTTATGGIFIGPRAAELQTTTGISNSVIVVGADAYKTATSGYNIVIIGGEALDAASNKEEVVAVGQRIARNMSGNGYITAVGPSALRDLTTGRFNVAVGNQAGLLSTTGQNNVFLGYQAGDATTTGSNQIVIGQGADASSATVSNEITLGNSSITNLRVPGVGFRFDTTDGLIVPKTITAGGTTGAQTINKTAGSVNFAAAATSLVVTNSFVDANSVIIATVATNDTTMKSVAVVAGAGSFTLHADVAPTAETRVNWFVAN